MVKIDIDCKQQQKTVTDSENNKTDYNWLVTIIMFKNKKWTITSVLCNCFQVNVNITFTFYIFTQQKVMVQHWHTNLQYKEAQKIGIGNAFKLLKQVFWQKWKNVVLRSWNIVVLHKKKQKETQPRSSSKFNRAIKQR